MDVSVSSQSRDSAGRLVVVFDVTEGQRTEEFTATVFRKYTNTAGNLAIDGRVEWTSADPIVVMYEKEDFVFPRQSNTGQQIVTNGGGRPYMDNDELAPLYTTGTATAHLLATDLTLKLLKELADNQADSGVTDALSALQVALTAPLIGQPYLTEGRTWKYESVATLTKAEMLDTVARAAWRKMIRLEAATALDDGSFDGLDPQ